MCGSSNIVNPRPWGCGIPFDALVTLKLQVQRQNDLVVFDLGCADGRIHLAVGELVGGYSRNDLEQAALPSIQPGPHAAGTVKRNQSARHVKVSAEIVGGVIAA